MAAPVRRQRGLAALDPPHVPALGSEVQRHDVTEGHIILDNQSSIGSPTVLRRTPPSFSPESTSMIP